MIKVCFLGTPEFAATHLKYLLSDPRFQVVGVVTQPDRPAGRKMQLTASAVKSVAKENNLPVLTPENLRKEPEIFSQIKNWGADVAVVVAFGQILAQEFLDSFKNGAVNVHGSLLPKWRGAAPIQRSIEAGDPETGVCLQKMVKKLDAGPVIGQRVIKLDQFVTATELYEKLALLGCELLKTDLVDFIAGKRELLHQDEALVTVAPKIEKEESRVQWSTSAQKIHNKVRAFSMGPGTYCAFQGKRLKLHKTAVADALRTSENIGHIVKADTNTVLIQTAVGILSLLEVQPESKSKMMIKEFIKIYPLKTGDSFE